MNTNNSEINKSNPVTEHKAETVAIAPANDDMPVAVDKPAVAPEPVKTDSGPEVSSR